MKRSLLILNEAMPKFRDISDPKSPCCGVKMAHEPDNIHFHYYCPKCFREFELDGESKRSYLI